MTSNNSDDGTAAARGAGMQTKSLCIFIPRVGVVLSLVLPQPRSIMQPEHCIGKWLVLLLSGLAPVSEAS